MAGGEVLTQFIMICGQFGFIHAVKQIWKQAVSMLHELTIY